MGCSDLMRGYEGKCENVEIWSPFEIEVHQSDEFERYRKYHEIETDDLNDVKAFVIWKGFGMSI